ncbi:MAG: NLP/P60 hydrolase, partial [Paracoccaceae bacterium]
MADARITPHSGRVALESLRGQMPAEGFVPGEAAHVVVLMADLAARPGGPLERQLPLGTHVTVIDRMPGWVFGQS